ncbi:hypothetical protein SAMN04488570_3055 [Nocardioides scoriae]|uniref:Uncharacterized protein n=1 Tax=Nocardioides scoriae TaxID=642780 RepID=A0A1H1W6H7_9ACTN|nr:hypothetical protein [Nocardioides scoriae]SDS92665.1 hypothetical protein SAMN04488570_3055 [Nocardioides scoriae]
MSDDGQRSIDLGAALEDWSGPDDGRTAYDGAGDPAVLDLLAAARGVGVQRLVEVYGAGWRELPRRPTDPDLRAGLDALHDVLAAPTWDEGGWYVAGEPFQLALRPVADGVELGVPVGGWTGAGSLEWEVRDRHHVPDGPDHDQAAGAVIAVLLRSRHRTFRWCRYCRSHCAPEQLLSPDTCHACGTRWNGIVY